MATWAGGGGGGGPPSTLRIIGFDFNSVVCLIYIFV